MATLLRPPVPVQLIFLIGQCVGTVMLIHPEPPVTGKCWFGLDLMSLDKPREDNAFVEVMESVYVDFFNSKIVKISIFIILHFYICLLVV